MGESSACLVRSMSQPSPTDTGEETANHMQRALTASISFGRFMSESLDWVKWSAFTQNRYLEEVEKYSKPGSVAEKKAYFEAHFKRRRAAALVEQQNAASDVTASDPIDPHEKNEVKEDTSPDLNLRQRRNCAVHQDTKERELQTCQNDDSAKGMVEDVRPGGVETLNEPQGLLECPVGLTIHLANVGCIDDDISKSENKACEKINAAVKRSVISSEKESEASSMLPKLDGDYKSVPSPPPFISIKPVQLKNSDKTPASNDNVKDSGNKRRSYSTSLHMSINLASCLGETQKCASPVRPKAENVSLNRAPAKRFKNSARSQTSTMASGIVKHHVRTIQQENRTEIIHGNSLSRSRALEGKVQSPSTKWCSKSSASFVGCKPRLTTVACPFTFKSEERAAKRKEKQEEKLRSNELEKQTPHEKPQVKERDKSKPMRNNITIKPIKIPDIFKSIDLSNNLPAKTSPARPCVPKVFEERASSKVIDSNNSRPPWRVTVSAKNDTAATGRNGGVTAKNKRLPINRTSKKNMSENASPNIQL